MAEIKTHLKDALAMADKREKACISARPCPECGTPQVQLVRWENTPEWKCRRCKHSWKDIIIKDDIFWTN